MKKFIILICLLIFLNAFASINVSYVGGEAYFKRGNESTRLTFGETLQQGDVIITRDRSFVALKMDDGSVHKVTANTTYEIKQYVETKQERKHIFSLLKGKVFSYVSKTFKRSDVKILTPTAVVGVRGTTFTVQFLEGKTSVYMLNGEVGVSHAAAGEGSAPVPVKKGEKATIDTTGTTEVEVTPMSEEDNREATKDVPSSLGQYEINQEQVDEEENSEEVADLRRNIDDASQRNEEQNLNNDQIKAWDWQNEKTIGNYRVVQNVTTPQENQVNLKTVTYDTGSDNIPVSTLNLAMTFDQSVPTYSDVVGGVTRNLDEISWDIKVANASGDKSDNLFYNKNYKEGSQSVLFNQKEGKNLTSKDYKFKGSNFKLPISINFKIENGDYNFSFDYALVNDQTINNVDQGIPITDLNQAGIYQQVLAGDLNTRITVTANITGGSANVLSGDGSTQFTLVILNGFLIPLFNNVSL